MSIVRPFAGALLFALLASGAHLPPSEPAEDMSVKEVIEQMEAPAYSAATTELALRLLRLTGEGNRMVSALSLSEALTMLAEGAEGETLTELEGAIGMSVTDLREALPAYLAALPSTEKAAFRSANAIWAEKNGFTLNEDYAKRVRDTYNAEIKPVSFAAPGVAGEINGWVSDATDGMIDRLVDDNSVRGLTMLLVNALCFDAEWRIPFEAETRKGDFTCADGSMAEVDYMFSDNDRLLIDHDGTLGFIKPYAGDTYRFVALLPPEGTSIKDYLAEMSGTDFADLIAHHETCRNLKIKMPRFKLDYSVTLNDTLRALGVERAFDGRAEFFGMGESGGRLYVDNILQKTHIDVDTKGTRAAAVTAIMMKATAFMPPEQYREVYLDRPFVYAIVDTATSTPIFIGTVEDLGE